MFETLFLRPSIHLGCGSRYYFANEIIQHEQTSLRDKNVYLVHGGRVQKYAPGSGCWDLRAAEFRRSFGPSPGTEDKVRGAAE